MAGDATDIRVEIQGTAADLRLAARQAVHAVRDVGQEARKQTVISRVAARDNQTWARSVDEVRVKHLGAAQAVRNFSTSWRAVGWSALIGNIGPVTAGLQDLAAAGLAAGSAVAPLGGLVATLPYGFGVAGQAAGVLKIAFHGVEDALNGNKDALAALDPEQRKLVDLLRNDLAPEIQKLQDTVQKGFLPGFDKGLRDALKLMPTVERVLGGTAEVMGDLSEQAGHMLGSPAVRRDIERFGRTNNRLLRDLGEGGLEFADGIRHVTMAAEPLVEHLGDLAERGGELFDEWAQAKRRSGDLADFFDLTSTRVDQSLSILGDFASVIGNLVSGSQPLADSMMSGLVGDMDRLAKITGSPQGQRALREFFDGAREPLHEVWLLAGDLVVDLSKLGMASQDELGRLARVLRTDALPAISDLATTISQDVMPDVVDLAGDLANLAHEVEPGLKPIVGMVGDIADGLGDIVDVTADVTAALPGVAKLIPSLAVGASVLASWRRLKTLMGGLPLIGAGKGGSLGTAPSVAAGLAGKGGTPANPLWVAVVNGAGLPGSGRGPSGGVVTKPGETRTKGGVILPPGVREPPAPKPSLGSRVLGAGKAIGTGAADMILPISITAAGLTGIANNGIPNLRGGADIIARINGEATTTARKVTDVGKAIDDIKKKATEGIGHGLLDPKVGKALQDLERYRDRLIGVENVMTPLRDQLRQLGQQQDYRGLAKLADHADDLRAKFPDAALQLDAFADRAREMSTGVVGQFDKMRRSAGGSLENIKRTTDQTTRQISRKLGSETKAGKDALAHNFELAVGAIRQSMQDGKVETDQGLAEIRKLFAQALEMYGVSPGRAKRVARQTSDIDTGLYIAGHGPAPTATVNAKGDARGGLHDLGRPGVPGRDRIPMVLNGQPVIAAEGESIAVLTRHQRRKLDRLAGHGGYRGLRDFITSNDRPNYMAQGGVVEAATGFDDHAGAGGGAKPLSFFATLARREDLTVTSNRRSAAENAAVGGAAGSFHLTGQAIDVSGSPGSMMAYAREVAAQYGRQLEELFYDPLGFYIKYGRRVAGAIGGHGDHVHVAETGGAGPSGGITIGGVGDLASAAMLAPWEDIKAPNTGMGGVLGQVVQAALSQAAAVANQQGRSLIGTADGGLQGSTYSGPLNRVFPPGVTLSESQTRKLLDAGGMGFMPMYIPIRESGLQPGVIGDDAAKGYGNTFGYGLLQVTTGVNGPAFEEVVARLGGWRQMLNPVKNIIAAKWLSDHAASPLAPWSATAAQGLLLDAVYAATGFGPVAHAADATDTIIGLGDPKAPDKSKKTKKTKEAARRKIPTTSGPGRPDLSKARARKHRKTQVKKIPQWIRDLAIPEGKEQLSNLRDYTALFEDPIAHLQAVIGNLEQVFDLSAEEPTVTLYDSAQYRDLTNWLTQHPEDLAGAKTPQEFIEKYGNGLEVVNRDGLTVQGRGVRGINARVGEIWQLLDQHTGSVDGTGQGGLLGLMGQYLTEVTLWGPAALNLTSEIVSNYLGQLRTAYRARREDRSQEKAKLRGLDRRSITAEERIAQLRAQQDMLRQYKEDIAKAAIGHRLTDEGKENRQWATDKISDLAGEISELQSDDGGPILRNKPKRPTGKRATPEALKQYRQDLADWERRQRRFAKLYAKTVAAIGFDERVMDKISGDHEGGFSTRGGVAEGWATRRQDIRDHRDQYAQVRVQLTDTDIPAERVAISVLQKEMGDLLATRVEPQPLDPTAGQAGDNSEEIARLLREQRDEALKQARVAEAQFDVFQGFAPLAGQRLLGAFLHGGTVPQTGPYLLHKDETVLTDPRGPFGSQTAGGDASVPVVNVYLEGDAAPLMSRVRAEIDGRAARVSSRQIGRQQRLVTAAPGGR